MINVNPTFMQGHPQPQGPPPQQAGMPGHANLSFMGNHPASAPGPSMLNGPPGAPNMGSNAQFMHMRQQAGPRPTAFVQQTHNGQPFNTPIQGGPSHLNGIGSTPLQSAPFGAQNIQQAIRRVPPQGQSLNQPMPGMGGQPAVGTVGGIPGVNGHMNGLTMAGTPGMRSNMQPAMRMSQTMMQAQGHLGEMNLNSIHQSQLRGPPAGMMPNVARTTSHGFIPNPPSAQSHNPNIPSMPQFQNQLNHANRPPNTIGPSPHVSPPHNTGQMNAPPLNHSASMPLPANRQPRMTPDNGSVMSGLTGPPPHMATLSSQFTYSHGSPPNGTGDASQMAGPSSHPVGGAPSLVNTPAQTLQQQLGPNFSFDSASQPPQPNTMRPSSQLGAHPGQMPNQQVQPNQPHQPPAMQQLNRPPSVVNRQSPFPDRRAGSAQSQRPPSRPSPLHNAQSPQHAAQPRTPRMSQPPPGVQTQPSNATPAPTVAPPQQPQQQQQPPPPPPSVNPEQSSSNSNHNAPPVPFNPSPVPRQTVVVQPMPPIAPTQRYHLVPTPGIPRLLAFSGKLGEDSAEKSQMSYWEDVVKDFFVGHATFKFTLWKDNQRMEAKPFEIGVPILPRFFLVTSQSGVKAMHLTLDNAREQSRPPGRCTVECPDAIWTFRYANGYVVTLKGALTATMVYAASNGGTNPPTKFETLSFDANHHDKMISLDAIIGPRQTDYTPPTPRQAPQTTAVNGTDPSQQPQPRKEEEPKVMVEQAVMPAEPVNAFGIPQATMRCLELAESVAQMSDLIDFSQKRVLGPLESLKQFAVLLRENHFVGFNMTTQIGDVGETKPSIAQDLTTNNASSPAYMGTPGQTHSQPPQVNSNGPQAGSSVDVKPSKSSLAQAQASVSSPSSGPTSATTPAASTPGASTSTPQVANATLKRKVQSDTASPTTSHDGPANKRARPKGGKRGG